MQILIYKQAKNVLLLSYFALRGKQANKEREHNVPGKPFNVLWDIFKLPCGNSFSFLQGRGNKFHFQRCYYILKSRVLNEGPYFVFLLCIGYRLYIAWYMHACLQQMPCHGHIFVTDRCCPALGTIKYDVANKRTILKLLFTMTIFVS